MIDRFLSDFSDPFASLEWEVAITRIAFSVLLGGLIGYEREAHTKPAGLRTHMLISLSACLFALIALDLMRMDADTPTQLRVDPLRLVEAVTAGVAFLAAGTIITGKNTVHGLTTGAGMWLAGAVGLACGTGSLTMACIATVAALIILWLLRKLFMETHNDNR
ncbi:MgtC/SapB family protein [Qingshengfaniella alkalisoli]|uniref:Protein MgtC n=1 Tax=Qingshengfaniella alkalisoli TaxID=2599296 RepID=A0A5B8ISE4_9RHOB|nr:MgtC/SapB family protein [Qingshengfaniella alkalisoli]QDY69132.1 MgtC/SapB family protein [Qingshengfaniella alkalisoli]